MDQQQRQQDQSHPHVTKMQIRRRCAALFFWIGLLLVLMPTTNCFAKRPVPTGLLPGYPYHLVFVSSNPFQISETQQFPPTLPFFGSRDEADWHGNSLAHEAGWFDWNGTLDDPLFLAVLSLNVDSARNRFPNARPVYNAEGELVFAGDPFAAATPANRIQTQFGEELLVGESLVWTGSNNVGFFNGDNCSNWSKRTDLSIAAVYGMSPGWLASETIPCDLSAHIYFLSRELTFGMESCDFNVDNACNIDDLNSMLAVGPIAEGVPVSFGDAVFDVTGDGIVNLDDRDEWLSVAAAADGFALL